MTQWEPNPMLETDEEMLKAKITKALSGHLNQWRTPGGIARETGLPLDVVEAYLREHEEQFAQSSIAPSGTPLYSSTHVPTQSS